MTKRVDPSKRQRGRWTDDQLRAAVTTSNSMTEVVQKLGMSAITNRAVRRRIDELDLDISHLPKKCRADYQVYTEQALREVVARSTSVSQVVRAFGARPVGSVLAHVRRRIDHYGISTEHFVITTAGRQPSNRLTPEQVFVVLPEGSHRREGAVLRRALIETGTPYICSECGLDEWCGKPLTLDVDHINGEWRDNRRENLRFLCPNCHSQTDTWRAMNRRRRLSKAQRARLVTSDS